MNLTCPKCQKSIVIADDKLPKDKQKAQIKCPVCQQIIIFDVPKSVQQPIKQEEKTVIDPIPEKPKATLNIRLIETATKTEYKLKIGKNIIGRKADISIDNGDKYISRIHCLIEIIAKTGSYDVILTDDGSISENGEPSSNGTFHNGKRLTKFDKIYLENIDKIKIGHSDFIIKTQ